LLPSDLASVVAIVLPVHGGPENNAVSRVRFFPADARLQVHRA